MNVNTSEKPHPSGSSKIKDKKMTEVYDKDLSLNSVVVHLPVLADRE